jgi:hypothetical protein
MLEGMLGKRNPHTLLVGMQASTTTLENNMEAFEKLKADLPYNPNSTSGIHTKVCESAYNKSICTPMFIAVLFTIAKLWKKPR